MGYDLVAVHDQVINDTAERQCHSNKVHYRKSLKIATSERSNVDTEYR